ncbi:uncharacterized protein STEHIDRAFT_113360 [Stereum hirsutum FP-91666 SS1]|uniref:uncharacterized protein n=1 Tax=Stereum hirsutum (strain FP-91666) TaxID=721885 RepID=UPI0004449374|nr:uncharacterized protein STEHIDRAFT_113360 [Stereum hirsutum FP-91666 SS1]EIM83176.1 hypothetical protein STEHIDRAFT_113360 [Stereum hirsutum FP-91666 SS1]
MTEGPGGTTSDGGGGGHEGVGITVALGDDSVKRGNGEDGSVRVGDRVGVKWTVDASGIIVLFPSEFSLPKQEELWPDHVYARLHKPHHLDSFILLPRSGSLPLCVYGAVTQEALLAYTYGLTVYIAVEKSNTIVNNWVVPVLDDGPACPRHRHFFNRLANVPFPIFTPVLEDIGLPEYFLDFQESA